MTVDIYRPTAQDSLSLKELDLYHRIVAYRGTLGLPALPLSAGLTTTAGRHVLDARENIWATGLQLPAGANLHSWSDAPYYADGRNPQVMWEAPERLGTGYASSGYEIAAAGQANAAAALEGWKASPPHRAILDNSGAWADVTFNAIGVGLENAPGAGPYRGRAYFVWFGEAADASGPPVIMGTARADTFRATPFADIVNGLGGADQIYGGTGRDRISGGAGPDSLFGESGHDQLAGGDGSDHLYGGDGNDILGGGDGADTLVGASGADRISGGAGADVIAGGAGNDILAGNSAADRILGGTGRDLITGGAGGDLMTGGPGADTFRLLSPAETGVGAARDTITDFSRGVDEIDLRAIDARPDLAGDQAFAFSTGSAANPAPGVLYYGGGLLQADTNGDGRIDFEIALHGAPAIDRDDFLL